MIHELTAQKSSFLLPSKSIFRLVIWITLVLAIGFVASEIAIEGGISPDMKCHSKNVTGEIIKKGFVNSPPVAETAPFAFLLNRVQFPDGLDYVSEGFPRNITSDICYECLIEDIPENTADKTILRDCNVYDANHTGSVFGQGSVLAR